MDNYKITRKETGKTYSFKASSEYIRKSVNRVMSSLYTSFFTKNDFSPVNADEEDFEILSRRFADEMYEVAPAESKSQVRNWKSDTATDAQLRYLVNLEVKLENDMTKGRASELISAAKDGDLSSVGGFYTDGSN